jgi:hypothetical protein
MTLASLWLPIVLSAVFVFVASALINMLLKFWHAPDYRKFANEDAVRAAIRAGNPAPGQYSIPWCDQETMKDPAMQEKFVQGPVGMVNLRRAGPVNMGTYLLQWFLFCGLVSVLCALVALVLPAGADPHRVFHTTALAALAGYALGLVQNAIWFAWPWKNAFKYMVDGLVYAIITGLTFQWLWPAT